LCAGVVVVCGLVAGLLATAGSSGPTPAPAFSLARLGGGSPVRLPVLEDGKAVPVVVTFFASWCGPCHAELPVVARVASTLEASGTRVSFVGVDGNDLSSSGLALARSSGVTFPVGKDPDSAVAPRFGIPGYPATAFVDAGGDVVHVVRGPVSAVTLRSWAERIALTT
jgi:cytochrome c biogenesis protein CcmG, thiol:disulfide interchange protein DsbE